METMAARGGFTARLPVWRRLGFRLGASFLALTALAVLLSGLLQYRAEAQSLRQSLGTLLLNIARTGALLVDGDTHETVVATGRGDSPQYAAIRERLRLIQESNQLADAVYTLTRPEGARSRFAVISNAVVPVGTEYPLVPVLQDALRRVFDEGVSAYTDVYTNHDGTWITAFAPVRNGRGQVVAERDEHGSVRQRRQRPRPVGFIHDGTSNLKGLAQQRLAQRRQRHTLESSFLRARAASRVWSRVCVRNGSPRCGAASTSTPSRARSSRSWPAWSSPGG